MEQHWKLKDLGQTILFAAIYFVIVLAATIMGGIHPLLYLLVTTLIALLAWIPYMYVTAKVPKMGVVLIMNLFVVIAFLAFGELANMLLISLIVCAILAEIVRRRMGYKNYKGVRDSNGQIYIPRRCADGSSKPTLNTNIFPNTPTDGRYFSSPPNGRSYSPTWNLHLGNGSIEPNVTDFGGTNEGYVRAVRSK